MSCYFLYLSAETDRGEFNESLIPRVPTLLGVGTVDICETLIPGFPPLLGMGTVDTRETLIPGFPPLLGVGTVDICCEQPTGKDRNVQRLPVPRLHPKQDVKHRIKVKLTREGSYR